VSVVALLFGLGAGIGLCAGAIFAIIGLSRRPRDRVSISFALCGFAAAASALATVALHQSASVEEYLFWLRDVSQPIALFSNVAQVWFVAFYTRVVPRRFLLLVVTLCSALLVVVNSLTPYSLFYSEMTGLQTVALPWGESFVVHDAIPHPWMGLLPVALILVMDGFAIVATVVQYRRGERAAAIWLGAASGVMLAIYVVNTLIDAGIVRFIYLDQFALLGFVVVMSVALTRQIPRTEAALQRYQARLETMVAERTVDLERANGQLTDEVMQRQIAQEALQLRIGQLDSLHRVASTLANPTDLASALSGVSEQVTDLLAVRYAHIMLVAEESAALGSVIGFERGHGPVRFSQPTALAHEVPLVHDAMNRLEPVSVADVRSLPLSCDMREFVLARGIRAMLVVPLVVRGGARWG
jgi:hypothetical protein